MRFYPKFELADPERWLEEGTRCGYYLLDGDTEAALHLAATAIINWSVKHRNEEGRWHSASTSKSITKVYLHGPFLLQRVLWELATGFEQRQEQQWRDGKRTQRPETLYHRYLKYLLLEAIRRRSYHTVIALAQILRAGNDNSTWKTYQALLSNPDQAGPEGGSDIRALASWRSKFRQCLWDRFHGHQVFEEYLGNKKLTVQLATDEEAKVIREALELFIPWDIPLNEPNRFSAETGWPGLIFKGKKAIDELLVEQQRMATVISPPHFDSMLKYLKLPASTTNVQLPKVNQMNNNKLEPPGKLPKFPGLSDKQIRRALVEIAKNGYERRKLHAAQIRVRVDGAYQEGHVDVERTSWLRRSGSKRFNLSPTACSLELCATSRESGEEVIISYLSIGSTHLDEGQTWTSNLRLEGRQLVKLIVEPELDDEDQLVNAKLTVAYREPLSLPSFREWRERALEHHPVWLRPQFAATLAVMVLLIVIAGYVYREPAWNSIQMAVKAILPDRESLPDEQRQENSPPPKEQLANEREPDNGPGTVDRRERSKPKSDLTVSEESARAVRDGGQVVRLDSQGRLIGLEEAPQVMRDVTQSALLGRTTVPEIIGTLQSDEESTNGTRGAGSDGQSHGPVLIGPVGTVIRNDRPSFKWRPVAGARHYVVRIFTPDFHRIQSSEQLTVTEWASATPLGRDVRYYRWQLDVVMQDSSLKEFKGKFALLDEAAEAELEAAERDFPHSHLLLGSLYARAGLLPEAQKEFRLLLKENPNSRVAQRLLLQVQRPQTRSPNR
jgi:hypothetical protein